MNQPHTSHAIASESPAISDAPLRIAVIASRWHQDIVQGMQDALLAEFEEGGLAREHIDLYRVPGAFEIPLHARTLALSQRYDAIVACGLVVNGGIYRHEFVAAAVIDGLMRVQLDSGVPLFSAVLTPRDFHEHEEHRRFFAEHFVKKGIEVAGACLATLRSLRQIRTMHGV